jgi:hypothetical protein
MRHEANLALLRDLQHLLELPPHICLHTGAHAAAQEVSEHRQQRTAPSSRGTSDRKSARR